MEVSVHKDLNSRFSYGPLWTSKPKHRYIYIYIDLPMEKTDTSHTGQIEISGVILFYVTLSKGPQLVVPSGHLVLYLTLKGRQNLKTEFGGSVPVTHYSFRRL